MILLRFPKPVKGTVARLLNGTRLPANQPDAIVEDGEGYKIQDIDANGYVLHEHQVVGTVIAEPVAPKAPEVVPLPKLVTETPKASGFASYGK